MIRRLSLPSRLKNRELARTLYGPLADRMFEATMDGDPLADEAIAALMDAAASSDSAAAAQPGWLDCVSRGDLTSREARAMPEALARLIREARALPSWVDLSRCSRAGRLLFRAGPLGGMVLATRSLLGGYLSPAGNKPLTFSGQLQDNVQFRLAETGRFVVATCEDNGLRPGSPGWGITLRVRLMHARVRQLLSGSPRWDAARWGVPISQHDLVGTTLLFSSVFVDGLRLLGLEVSEEEEEDYAHLWRVSGWLMGIGESLQPVGNFESHRLGRFIEDTQAPPDADSVALTAALLGSPRVSMHPLVAPLHVAVGEGCARFFLGQELADSVRVPRRASTLLPPLIYGINRVRRLAGVEKRSQDIRRGRAYWDANLKAGFDGRVATFAPATSLRRSPK